jgi:hypothetical protein
MLTNVFGVLVKDTLKGNFYIEKQTFYILKRMIATLKGNFCIEKQIFYILKRIIAHIPMLNYYIKFFNYCPGTLVSIF